MALYKESTGLQVCKIFPSLYAIYTTACLFVLALRHINPASALPYYLL
jgi:hypothetical protein